MTADKTPEVITRPPGLLPEFASLVVVIGLLTVLGYAFIRDQMRMRHAETPLIVDVKTTIGVQPETCGPPSRNGRPTAVSMLYSNDKQAWIEDAAQSFSKLCPNIQIKLTSMGDIESAAAILKGEEKPTLWGPADDLVVRYLDAQWTKNDPGKKPLFDIAKQTSVAASPTVVLLWRNRARVVERVLSTRVFERGPWVSVACAQVAIDPVLDGVALGDMVPGTWIDWYNPIKPPPSVETEPSLFKLAKPKKTEKPAAQKHEFEYHAPFPTLDQIKSWGRVKVGHTSPTRSAAGLEAIYLMAYDYLLPWNERPIESGAAQARAVSDPAYRGRVFMSDIGKAELARALTEKKPAFHRWLRRCEAGLDPAPKSAKLLTNTFFNVGEDRYDAVVTYEHLTFEVFKRINEYAGTMANVELYYPTPTLMNQHPVVTIDADSLSDVEKLSVQKWLDYLRSVKIQEKAIEYGLRPVNPQVSIREYQSDDNPFLHYRRYGVDFDSPIIEPPRLDGRSVSDIIRIWEDATGRH